MDEKKRKNGNQDHKEITNGRKGKDKMKNKAYDNKK